GRGRPARALLRGPRAQVVSQRARAARRGDDGGDRRLPARAAGRGHLSRQMPLAGGGREALPAAHDAPSAPRGDRARPRTLTPAVWGESTRLCATRTRSSPSVSV